MRVDIPAISVDIHAHRVDILPALVDMHTQEVDIRFKLVDLHAQEVDIPLKLVDMRKPKDLLFATLPLSEQFRYLPRINCVLQAQAAA